MVRMSRYDQFPALLDCYVWSWQARRSTACAAADSGVSGSFCACAALHLCSEEFVEAWTTKAKKNRLKDIDWDTLDLKTLIVDPPRAGLDSETEKLMLEFDNIVYVSCNPETLHENLKAVEDTHDIKSFAIFDQFPFTHHIECGVYLTKKAGEPAPETTTG